MRSHFGAKNAHEQSEWAIKLVYENKANRVH